MSKNKYKDKLKIGDYPFWCDTCGTKAWASEATRLDVYTGKGGAFVCRDCVDIVDYGLVPYTVLPETPIPFCRPGDYAGNPNAIPNTIAPDKLDLSTMDPMSFNNPATDPRLQ